MSTSPDDTDFYDAELRRYNTHLCAAAAVRPEDHTLDLGTMSSRDRHAAMNRK